VAAFERDGLMDSVSAFFGIGRPVSWCFQVYLFA